MSYIILCSACKYSVNACQFRRIESKFEKILNHLLLYTVLIILLRRTLIRDHLVLNFLRRMLNFSLAAQKRKPIFRWQPKIHLHNHRPSLKTTLNSPCYIVKYFNNPFINYQLYNLFIFSVSFITMPLKQFYINKIVD